MKKFIEKIICNECLQKLMIRRLTGIHIMGNIVHGRLYVCHRCNTDKKLLKIRLYDEDLSSDELKEWRTIVSDYEDILKRS